jgi:hypothetical protein
MSLRQTEQADQVPRVYIIVVVLHYVRFLTFDISDDYIAAMKNDFPPGTDEFITVTSTRRLDLTRFQHRRAAVNNVLGIINSAMVSVSV